MGCFVGPSWGGDEEKAGCFMMIKLYIFLTREPFFILYESEGEKAQLLGGKNPLNMRGQKGRILDFRFGVISWIAKV